MTGDDRAPREPDARTTARGPGGPDEARRPTWGPYDRRERWGGRGTGAWGPSGGPWRHGGWPPGGRGWFVRRFAGLIVALLLIVVLMAAVAGWVLGSVFGLLGPDLGGGGPHLVAARLLGVGLVVLGLAVVVRRVRGLAAPLDELVEATGRIEAGDYTTRVAEPERGPRELRGLVRRFNTMAARLETDERQRRSLLADVSHELRTPLAVVQGSVEAIVDGVHPADDAHLGAILEETHVLSRLVDDLRTLALSESGTLPLHREPTDLGLLVSDVARSFGAAASTGGVTLEATVPDDLPTLDVDPVRIREVLGNLVANAVRHTPRDGRVAITAAPEGDRHQVRVAVRDSGPGLSPEVAARVFDRFAKSSDSRGSGLGLAIAKHLVEAHGGEIGIESTPGGGTTAWFRLPADEA